MLEIDPVEICLITRRLENRVIGIFFPWTFRMPGAGQAKGHPVLARVFAPVIVGAARVKHKVPVADLRNTALAGWSSETCTTFLSIG